MAPEMVLSPLILNAVGHSQTTTCIKSQTRHDVNFTHNNTMNSGKRVTILLINGGASNGVVTEAML
jgi:hypothetical protein